MIEKNTNSLLSKALEWLPKTWHELAKNSSTMLNIILNEVVSDRDIRITGAASAARPECALIAAIQKMLQEPENKRVPVIVLCPSRESENIVTEIATSLCSNTDLVVRPTALMRTVDIARQAFSTPADIIITSLRTWDKLLRADAVKPEQIRTVILDDLEWFRATGELNKLKAFLDVLPAARQLIAITKQGELHKRFVDVLQTPSICRAPVIETSTPKVKERLIVAPEDKWGDIMTELAEGGSSLFIAENPASAKRIISLLRDAGHDPKWVSLKQTDTARATLILKFSANLVPHVVMSTQMLFGVKKGTVQKIVHTDMPCNARCYLDHMNYLETGGEIVTFTTPEELSLFDALLITAEKKLKVENPYRIEGMPTVVGEVEGRQKLTVRHDYQKEAEAAKRSAAKAAAKKAADAEASVRATMDAIAKIVGQPVVTAEDNADIVPDRIETVESVEEPIEKRPYKRKNPKFAKTKYVKKGKFQRKPRINEEDEATPENGDSFIEDPIDVPSEKKRFKKRFPAQKNFEKRPYRERNEDLSTDEERASVTATDDNYVSVNATLTTDRSEGKGGERTWRPKTKYNRIRKPYNKDRRQTKAESEESRKTDTAAPVREQLRESSDEEGYDKPKKFTKYPQKKRPYQSKAKKPHQKHRDDWYDDDNFGNSIHYQPRRQNLRNLRSDEPLHWEPSDPYHPSSQALSLPQIMPDENGFRPNRSRNDHKGNYNNRPRKPSFKKRRGSGEN